MDRTEIKRLFGAKHVAEIEALTNGASLPSGLGLKNPKVTLILSIFLGMLGIDRLYQSGVKVFFCKLGMLLFSLGTWWLVDIGYSIPMTQEENYKKMVSYYAA